MKDEIVDEDSIDEEFEEAEDFVVEDDDDDDPGDPVQRHVEHECQHESERSAEDGNAKQGSRQYSAG